MRIAARLMYTLVTLSFASNAWGHGFALSVAVDGLGHPTSLTATSEAAKLDQTATPLAGPANLFLDRFSVAATTDGTGTWYSANGGAPATSGPWPAYTSATYTILSPLYYADGTGPAVPASAGTHLTITNRFPGDPAHPGAVAGTVDLSAATSIIPGYDISLFDAHELGKKLYIGAGSTQTFGVYGFAFSTTVHFADGSTFTTGPLVEIFALRDPSLPGGSFLTASQSQQAAASLALYQAVPEPSTLILAGCGVAALLLCSRRGGYLRRA